jgi:hypothetical protein
LSWLRWTTKSLGCGGGREGADGQRLFESRLASCRDQNAANTQSRRGWHPKARCQTRWLADSVPNADDAVLEECPSGGCRCPDVGSVVISAARIPHSFRADVAGSFGVLAAGHPCDVTPLSSARGWPTVDAAKRLPALLEGPSTTRGERFLLRAALNHSIPDSGRPAQGGGGPT